ncbi:MAG TPA: M20/M25/M40 family metallo-hydrolase [Methylomirabilota bacterium]|nr:M20/M25/M40 family metallo-hydrolase [Methylomirabilota bacterium]
MPSAQRLSRIFLLSIVVAAVVAVVPDSRPGPGAQPAALAPHQQLLREIYQELIEINTTNSVGDNTKAAEAMARRLLDAGFPAADVKVLAPVPRKGNLVARLRGTGARRPLLLLAHLDVVEANREDWSVDPFKLLERDGYFYGRGTTDDKAMAASFVANLIRYKREGFVPDRDLIVALTADEEGGGHNGVVWLLKEHRALIDAEMAINEGGGGSLSKGRRVSNSIQASEKIVLNYQLEVTNKGGHSSLPVRDNAIWHLAGGLARLGEFDFPVNLDEVNRGFFERTAAQTSGSLGDDIRAVVRGDRSPAVVARVAAVSPAFNSRMRTTCVPTRLEGGHANNALPQTARATVNCRVLPNETEEDVRQTLIRALANDKITVTATNRFFPSPPSPLTPEIMGAVERATQEMWPGVPVVPTMSTGATDSRYLRTAGIPAYGTSGMFGDVDDIRAHGRDERMLVRSLYEGQEYLYRLVKLLSSRP